eukprot:TRINITY_DN4685_c0_g1_i1.p1 TRINITY_DN4685_c0_g1~~TRINITY_DN4685_c0_g1_i1.p1  ORF type:complete len:681 (-),score=292.48 TRINITY_DN4685_c0_g1_i1:8-1990(-)
MSNSGHRAAQEREPVASEIKRQIVQHARVGQWRAIVALVRKLGDDHWFDAIDRDPMALGRVLKAFRESSSANDVLRLYEHACAAIGDVALIPTDVHNIVLGALARARRVDDCLRLFAENYTHKSDKRSSTGAVVRNVVTAHTYTTMVSALARAGRQVEAREMMVQMHRDGGFQPNAATYTALFGSLPAIADPVMVLREALQSGVRVDCAMCNVLLRSSLTPAKKADKTSTNTDAVAELLRFMQEQRVRPNSQTFTILMKHYGECGDWRKVDWTRMQMNEFDVDLDLRVCTMLMGLYAQANQHERIFYLLEDMARKRIEPTTAMCTVMLRHFRDCGLADAAVHLVGEMRRWNVSMDARAWTVYLALLGDARRVDELVRQSRRLLNISEEEQEHEHEEQDVSPVIFDATLLQSMVGALFTAKQHAVVVEVFHAFMIKYSGGLRGDLTNICPSAATVHHVIRSAGLAVDAPTIALLRSRLRDWIEPTWHTFGNIVLALGDLPPSRAVVDDLRSCVDEGRATCGDSLPPFVVTNCLLTAASLAERLDSDSIADSLVEWAVDLGGGERRVANTNARMANALVQLRSASGDTVAAAELLGDMRARHWAPSVDTTVAFLRAVDRHPMVHPVCRERVQQLSEDVRTLGYTRSRQIARLLAKLRDDDDD